MVMLRPSGADALKWHPFGELSADTEHYYHRVQV